MPDVISVRFKKCGKIYDFEVNGAGIEFKPGNLVIVESELGLSIGAVVIGRHTVETTAKALSKVLRMATEDDIKQKQDNEGFEKEAKEYCLERIMARGFAMKLITTEATIDRKRIIFYFTADGRIDFREIVKDLAAKFKTRIEMRQIGVRDEAKIMGGFGICGRELCCKTFLTSFEPISIKMAKQQDLVLNMSKLSGVCGRLMCCLSYEISDETNETPVAGNTEWVIKEEIVLQAKDVVEDAPKAEGLTPTDKITEAAPENNAANAKSTNKEGTDEQRAEQGHRKRKKWRWRRFHRNG